MATVQFVFTATRILKLSDSDPDAEDRAQERLAKQLSKMGFKVDVEDVGIVDEDDLDENADAEDDDDLDED